jgi:hypothetical protein
MMTMMMVVMMVNMEIVQDKKARKEEARTPEWERNPSVQVAVVPGRWIISNHWRTFIIVVPVNDLRGKVFTARRRLTFCVLFGSGYKSQTKFSGQALECMQSFLFPNG